MSTKQFLSNFQDVIKTVRQSSLHPYAHRYDHYTYVHRQYDVIVLSLSLCYNPGPAQLTVHKINVPAGHV